MKRTISREQVVRALRARKWKFKRETERVEIYKLPNNVSRIDVPRTKKFPILLVRTLLGQAGFTPDEIEKFLGDADVVE